jgi:large subunit ribosomal protein L3
MSSGLLGKKLGMTSLFSPEGRHVPITVLKIGPCVVTQIKTEATDGYNAIQVGFGEKRKTRVNKALTGHFAKSGKGLHAVLKEFRVDNPEEYSLGQTLTVEFFDVGERVQITGYTKGRGFAGVIKRHGFHGGRETHGSMSHRVPGSIGCSAWPSRVVKGKKLPGHYGNAKKSLRNMEIVDIRPEENILLLRGPVPGSVNSFVEVKKQGLAK